MRETDAERITLGRECADFAGFKRKVVWQDEDIVVERIEGQPDKPFTTFAEALPGCGTMVIIESGAILIRSEIASNWKLAPPSGLAVTRGPRRVILRIAKGAHAATIVNWTLESQAALTRALDELFELHLREENGLGLPTRSTAPHFALALERFRRALTLPNQTVGGALIRSVIAEAIAFVGDNATESILAPTPSDLPDNLQTLVDSVRVSPRQPWPLKDASDQAQYSPFHFSRVFKQLVGYGFHEFVDRVRCETAVQMLCDSDDPVDIVASVAGYSTAQGLRDALKEYLGLSPKDFRTEPHHSLIR